MRKSMLTAAVCLSMVSLCSAGEADAALRKQTHVPAQRLGPALNAFAKERGLQVVYQSKMVGRLQTHGAAGNLSADEELKQLLVGTGLTFKYVDERTVTLLTESSTSADLGSTSGNSAAKGIAGKSLLLSQATPASPSSGVTESPMDGQTLAEVIVTAQKREERLQDVPVPVTSLSAQTLLVNSQTQLRDYFSMVPGLSLTPGGGTAAIQTLAIRGITTGGNQNPTVGITVDDVPFGASTAGGSGGGLIPDIDPADLARVEVLRGPQGTLYGASSLGGLLKYVTVDPSTERLSGHVQAGALSIRNGNGLGYNGSAALNVPLGDALAVRVSAFTRRTPGYVDDVATHQEGVNKEKIDGGRLSALWRPSDAFTAKLGALIQQTRWDGSPSVFLAPGFGDLQQSYILGTGAQNTRLQSYSLVLTGKAGGADLTSVSGYNINSYHSAADVTSALGIASAFINDNKTQKFTQEFRLATALGSNFDWRVGAFYTHERSRFDQGIVGIDTTSGARAGSFLAAGTPTSYKEYAAFTDLTWKITDQFDVQFGGRESHIKQEVLESTSRGPFVGGVSVTPAGDSTANVFTYLVTPRFRISPDVMLYARLASGYRAGGPNANFVLAGAPPQYSPDKTQNYELGAKADFLEHTLSFDASVYYIDWRDIQLQLFNSATSLGYTGNGNRAKSQGVELSVETKPLTGLSIAAWVAFADAKLSEALPASSTVVGASGDRLPLSSRFSGNLSLQQSFTVTADVTGFVGGSVSYAGNREGAFEPTAQRQSYAGYAQTNLRAGVEYDTWTANVFVNNAADKRAVLSGGIGSFPPTSFQIIQPRTVGLSLLKSF